MELERALEMPADSDGSLKKLKKQMRRVEYLSLFSGANVEVMGHLFHQKRFRVCFTALLQSYS